MAEADAARLMVAHVLVKLVVATNADMKDVTREPSVAFLRQSWWIRYLSARRLHGVIRRKHPLCFNGDVWHHECCRSSRDEPKQASRTKLVIVHPFQMDMLLVSCCKGLATTLPPFLYTFSIPAIIGPCQFNSPMDG